MTSNNDLRERLHAIVGDAGLVTDADANDTYLRDWLGKWHGAAAAIVRPGTTEEVAAVVRMCNALGTPIVPQGGNTGMSGGGTPDVSGHQVILSTTRLRRIRDVDPVNNTLTAEAGVVLAHVQLAARNAGRFFPMSLGAEGSCTIGGNLATNAGGTAVLRYGNMRDLALGIEAVLPDGRIWHGLRALRKDNTGYDLRGLMIGAEGTLGIITAAVLKLHAAPAGHVAAWVGCDSPETSVTLLARLREVAGERLTACEMMSAYCVSLVANHVTDITVPLRDPHPYHLLVELSDTDDTTLTPLLERVLGEAMEKGWARDVAVAVNESQRRAFWRIREGISQAQVRAGKAVKHDIALPISRLAAFITETDALLARDFPDLPQVNFGHIGDGNLHYNVLLPLDVDADRYHVLTDALNRCVHDQVASYDGSISAEHGVGVLRREELRRYKSSVELDVMRRIKQALDPNHIMNPGKLL